MKSSQYLQGNRIYFWLLVLVEITLFFPIKINTYAIVALAFFWLLHTLGTQGKPIVRHEFWLFLLFFALFLVGMVHTNNFPQGATELEKRSALFVLPLIIFTCKITPTRTDLEKFMLYFFYAGLFVSLGLITFAFFRFLKTPNAEVFFYKELIQIINLHPVYFSYYLLFGLLAHYLIRYKAYHKHLFFWIVNLYAIIILVLLASKMVLAILFMITVLLVLTYFKSISFTYKIAVIGIFAIFLLSSVFLFSEVKDRVTDIFHLTLGDVTQERYAYNYPFNGLTLRLVIWKLSIQHLYADGLLFFGVGTGDTTDYMNEVYGRHGLLDGGYVNYNAHNEYVETLMTLGLAGLLFMSFIYLWGLYKAYSQRNFFLVVFLLIFSRILERVIIVGK